MLSCDVTARNLRYELSPVTLFTNLYTAALAAEVERLEDSYYVKVGGAASRMSLNAVMHAWLATTHIVCRIDRHRMYSTQNCRRTLLCC